ncbi:hypothetical protein [Bremerella cremea]|uniref:hypothetical protein n=1 Tax=Bremerella cremea TaxID=1031537 RepID=UPI0031F07325
MPQVLNTRPNTIAVGLLLLALGTSGCYSSSNWQERTYPVTGTVTINGQKAENAFVVLYSSEGKVDVRGSQPWAIVEADGTFRMTTYERGDGAPVGTYDLTLYWPKSPMGDRADRLKGAYSSPDKAVMSVTVERGTNELPPIELENIPVLPPATGPSGNPLDVN